MQPLSFRHGSSLGPERLSRLLTRLCEQGAVLQCVPEGRSYLRLTLFNHITYTLERRQLRGFLESVSRLYAQQANEQP